MTLYAQYLLYAILLYHIGARCTTLRPKNFENTGAYAGSKTSAHSCSEQIPHIGQFVFVKKVETIQKKS